MSELRIHLSAGTAALVAVLGLAGCVSPEGELDDPSGWQSDSSKSDGLEECGVAPAVQRPFRAWGIREGGFAHHGANDAVTVPGVSAVVMARFQYGFIRNDLEFEDVSLWLRPGDTCDWREVAGATTNEQGVAEIVIPGENLDEPGRYEYQVFVDGDRSLDAGSVWVLEQDAELVVFDIDGTLTTSDWQTVQDVFGGDAAPMITGADGVVQRYAELGVLPVYITTRSLMLDELSRSWLGDHEFPRGPLYHRNGYLLDSKLEHKLSTLLDIKERGLTIRYAYGNAESDICAYAEAGIAPADTFIVGKHAGKACAGFAATNALLSFVEHLADVDALVER